MSGCGGEAELVRRVLAAADERGYVSPDEAAAIFPGRPELHRRAPALALVREAGVSVAAVREAARRDHRDDHDHYHHEEELCTTS
jgi:hypothetical protein